jgi:hypothetical protein
MKIIITENQHDKIKVLRRLGYVDDLLNNELKTYITKLNIYINICDYNLDDFFTMIIQWVCERMYYNYFSDINDQSEEWNFMHNIIVKYLESAHFDTVKDFYHNHCTSN